jgi:hypothetical protein
LNGQLSKNLVALTDKENVKRAIEKGLLWLLRTRIEGKARWLDYPFASDGRESLSLSGLVLHVLHSLDPSFDREIDGLWLQTLPSALPKVSEYDISGHPIDLRSGSIERDNVRNYILAWIIIGTMDAYAGGTLSQRAAALAFVEQVLANVEEMSRQVIGFPWIAAEFLTSLRYINREKII